MWKRSQCEVNASCTSTAFPQSLVLSGPIVALDPPSYEAGLGHTQGWEEALKTLGFHLKPGNIISLEEVHGNAQINRSNPDRLKGEGGCSLCIGKNLGASLRLKNKMKVSGESKVVLSHFSLLISSLWQHFQRVLNVKCVKLPSLSLRFALWNVNAPVPLKWCRFPLPAVHVACNAEEIAHCFYQTLCIFPDPFFSKHVFFWCNKASECEVYSKHLLSSLRGSITSTPFLIKDLCLFTRL